MKWITASERLPVSIPGKPIQIYYKYKSGDGKYWKGASNTINQFLDFAKLAPTNEVEWLDESLPSGGKSVEEVEQWYHQWMSDRGKRRVAPGEALTLLKDFASQYAHQQPGKVQLCPKCNGEGKCFEILIPTEYRVCPVCNGNKILYPPINQQPVNGYSREQMEKAYQMGRNYEYAEHFGAVPILIQNFEQFMATHPPVNDGWVRVADVLKILEDKMIPEPPKQTV